MKYPISLDALDDRLAILGTAGSGKTYLTLGAIERLLADGARVVAIDPLGVMWGLRLKTDGKTASPFDIPIFGGPHGDLPLTENAGALIGETVATMRESCIIDLSELPTKSAERRFMTAFLDAIYRHTNRGNNPYHLIVDEADRFAPQKPPKGDETMLNRMEEIVRRGRVKGFIPWLITQRPAVLNKNVLSQADGLVLLKLTSSQDRDQVGAWIEGQADRAEGKKILGSLPAMQRGQGVVWIPGRGILDTVQFPPKTTFDSSATPKRGEKKREGATLKSLNLDALKKRLEKVETETKANDPAKLKAEIAQLNVALKKARNADKEVEIFKELEKARDVIAAIPLMLDDQHKRSFVEGYGEAMKTLDAISHVPSRIAQRVPGKSAEKLLQTWANKKEVAIKTDQRLIVQPVVRPRMTPPAPVSNSGTLPGPQQRILNSLATWGEMEHHAPSNAQVAWLANYSPSSTSYTNPRSALVTAGLIEYPSPDRVAITTEGIKHARAIEIADLFEFVVSQLPGPEQRILRSVAAKYPESATNDEAAEGAGYSASSTSYTNPRSALKTKDLITYPSNGRVRAAEWLFQ